MRPLANIVTAFAATLLTAVCAATPAHAVLRSFMLTPGDIAIALGASGDATSITLPDAGMPDIGMSIVLPADYQTNSIVNLRLIMGAANGGGATCSIVMEPVTATRRRNGVLTLQGLAGITPANGSTTTPFGPGKANFKAFSIGPAGTGDYVDMKPSDWLFLRFHRNAAAAADTCAFPAFLFGVEVRYTATK